MVVLLAPKLLHSQMAPQSPGAKIFDVASDPEFQDYQRVLTHFAQRHRPKATNHFCIIGYQADTSKSAWVLWREGGEILLWEGNTNLDLSRRIIHLKSDVVPTDKDLHGSTYLVTKAWVALLSKSCESSGRTLTLSTAGVLESKAHKVKEDE